MKHHITWDSFGNDLKVLADNIKNTAQEFTHLVMIGRGGYIPGTFLSHNLGIDSKQCYTMVISSYEGEAQTSLELVGHQTNLLNELKTLRNGHKVLVVDDLVETGNTLKLVLEKINNNTSDQVLVETAVVYKKGIQEKIPINHYAKDYELDKWLVFPYE